MIKKISALTLATSILVVPAIAKVSFSLDVEALSNAGGTALSTTGLLVLVVDTGGDGFAGPTAGNLASGNDKVVQSWDLSKVGPGTADITLLTEGGVAWDADWAANDALALYWFPALSESNQSPAADEAYGVFADAASLASGDSWKMPADGTLLHSLKLFTEAATKLVIAGDFPNSLGKAAYSVMAPPQPAAAPTSIALLPNDSTIEVTWTGGNAAGGGFIVQRALAGSNQWETVGFSGVNSFTDDSSVKGGFTYDYRVFASNGLSAASYAADMTVEAERSVFGNVSARASYLASQEKTKLAGGFILTGNAAEKNVVMQAIGRNVLGIPSFVVDPKIDVNEQGVPLVSNDNWLSATNATDIDVAMDEGNAVPLAASADSKDASVLIKAKKGLGYTFETYSADGANGEVLLGIFSADSTTLGENDNRIRNLSARGYIGSGDGEIMAGGIIVKGDVPKQVLVMAWGKDYLEPIDPSLTGLTAENPKLILRRLSVPDVILAENDDWETQSASAAVDVVVETDSASVASVIKQIGYPDYIAGSSDAALLLAVPPGAYTFEVNGNGGSGIALIAIEEVEFNY